VRVGRSQIELEAAAIAAHLPARAASLALDALQVDLLLLLYFLPFTKLLIYYTITRPLTILCTDYLLATLQLACVADADADAATVAASLQVAHSKCSHSK